MTKKTGDILFFLILVLVAAAFCCMASPYGIPVRRQAGPDVPVVIVWVSYFIPLTVISLFSINAGVGALVWLVALVVSKWRGSDPSPWTAFFSGVSFLSSLFCLVYLIADSYIYADSCIPWLAIGVFVLLAVAFLLQFIRTYHLPHDFKIIFPLLWSAAVSLLILLRILLTIYPISFSREASVLFCRPAR